MAEVGLAAIDLVTLHMDFDTGADRDIVLGRMLPRVAAQNPPRLLLPSTSGWPAGCWSR